MGFMAAVYSGPISLPLCHQCTSREACLGLIAVICWKVLTDILLGLTIRTFTVICWHNSIADEESSYSLCNVNLLCNTVTSNYTVFLQSNNLSLPLLMLGLCYRRTCRPMWTLRMFLATSRNRSTQVPVPVLPWGLMPVPAPLPIPLTPPHQEEEITVQKIEQWWRKNMCNVTLVTPRCVVTTTYLISLISCLRVMKVFKNWVWFSTVMWVYIDLKLSQWLFYFSQRLILTFPALLLSHYQIVLFCINGFLSFKCLLTHGGNFSPFIFPWLWQYSRKISNKPLHCVSFTSAPCESIEKTSNKP